MGNAAFITECIMDIHSDSSSVQAGNRYFSFEEIFERRAYQVSCLEEFSGLVLDPPSIPVIFCSFITVELFPSGFTHTPTIFEASCMRNIFSNTHSPVEEVATRSTSVPASLSTRFPFFHINSTKYDQFYHMYSSTCNLHEWSLAVNYTLYWCKYYHWLCPWLD